MVDARRVKASLVSPEFRLRPSLSDGDGASCRRLWLVSPEFRLRPSLSVEGEGRGRMNCSGVAGVQTPAFVERRSSTAARSPAGRVSPEFRLRPSLSVRVVAHPPSRPGGGVAGVQTPAFVERRGTSPRSPPGCGRVAGVQTPAFVERPWPTSTSRRSSACRRSSDSGLR